jgi:hypothetical protein
VLLLSSYIIHRVILTSNLNYAKNVECDRSLRYPSVKTPALLQTIAKTFAACATSGDASGCAFAHAAAEAYAAAVSMADASAFALAFAECDCKHTSTNAFAWTFADASYFKFLYVEAESKASAWACTLTSPWAYCSVFFVPIALPRRYAHVLTSL